MSDTPSTDNEQKLIGTYRTGGRTTEIWAVRAEFARRMERELAAVTAALARLVELQDMKERADRDNDGWVELEYFRTRAAAWEAARAALRGKEWA